MYVLYKKTGVHSGRALRKMLAELTGERVQGGFPKRFLGIARRNSPDVVINLGVTDDLPYEGEILNTQDMVRAASNKKKARQIFAEQGVPAPELFLRSSEVSQEDLPVIGRTSYHHKGQGFWFCKTRSQVRRAAQDGATHFLKFIPQTREYRVHTFIKKKSRKLSSEERTPDRYVSVKISEKVWEGDGKQDANVQKNHGFGWVFRAPQSRREEELDVVRWAAKQAISALSLDFGAVDIMYSVRAKQPYVLEINSTPSLADEGASTCEVYAKRILKTLEASTGEE